MGLLMTEPPATALWGLPKPEGSSYWAKGRGQRRILPQQPKDNAESFCASPSMQLGMLI